MSAVSAVGGGASDDTRIPESNVKYRAAWRMGLGALLWSTLVTACGVSGRTVEEARGGRGGDSGAGVGLAGAGTDSTGGASGGEAGSPSASGGGGAAGSPGVLGGGGAAGSSGVPGGGGAAGSSGVPGGGGEAGGSGVPGGGGAAGGSGVPGGGGAAGSSGVPGGGGAAGSSGVPGGGGEGGSLNEGGSNVDTGGRAGSGGGGGSNGGAGTAGEESEPPRCESGAARCDGELPELCENGEWVPQAPCPASTPLCTNGICGTARLVGGIVTVGPPSSMPTTALRLVDHGFDHLARNCGTVRDRTVCVIGGIHP